MGSNFIGPNELKNCVPLKLKVFDDYLNESVPYSETILKKVSSTHYLIYAVPFHMDGKEVNILSLRSIFGTNPQEREPCFYNQDWYLKESFVKQPLYKGWYLISKGIKYKTRGKLPQSENLKLTTAILATYTFFAVYLIRNEIYLVNDYTWNDNHDSNGDIIYTGKYIDPLGLNKNGWEIHRHLTVKMSYGISDLI